MTIRRGQARGTRGIARVFATGAAVLAVLGVAAGPASATAYRYWSYWHGTPSGGWSFSPVGASYQPPAGSVDGWRFAVSGVAGSVQPRAVASFATICAQHAPAASGDKLVGLVVDFGTTADAPPGQHPPRGVDTFCADLPDNGTSAQVLDQYSSVRTESGLVCAIDGYPVGECGVIVQPTPTPTARTSQPTSHSPQPTRSRSVATSSSRSSAGSSPVPTSSTVGAGGGSLTTGSAATAGSAGPSTALSSGGPMPVAVGSGGVRPAGDGSGAPPAGALAGAAVVLLVGGAAAVRAARSAHRDGTRAP